MITGAVGFSADDSIVSRAIRWITRSEWSHVFLVAGEFHGTTLVLEATASGVGLHRFDDYLSKKYRIEIWMLAPENPDSKAVERGIHAAMRVLGQPYPWMQLAGMGLVIAARRLLGLKIRNPFRRWDVCSEILLRHLRESDPQGPWSWMDKDTTSPEMISADFRRDAKNWMKIL